MIHTPVLVLVLVLVLAAALSAASPATSPPADAKDVSRSDAWVAGIGLGKAVTYQKADAKNTYLERAERAAKALGLRFDPLPAPAKNFDAAIAYLMAASKTHGDALGNTRSLEHAAIFKLGVGVQLAPLLYRPKEGTGTKLARGMKDLALVGGVPPTLLAPLTERLEADASLEDVFAAIDQVGPAVFTHLEDKARAAAASSDPASARLRAILEEFLKPGADYAALTSQLRPTDADFLAVYKPEPAAKLKAMYDPVWASGALVLKLDPEKTNLEIHKATTEDIKAWNTTADSTLPGGYREVADVLLPGITVYTARFKKPGAEFGTNMDGLVEVNGRWRIFPKPWRAFAPPPRPKPQP